MHLKCISGINVSPAKTTFLQFISFYTFKTLSLSSGVLLKGVFNPKLLSNPPASWSLINLFFFHSFAVFTILGFLLSMFFPALQAIDKIVLHIV